MRLIPFIALLCLACSLPSRAAPAVAFFYGVSPPVDELAAFDAVVLEPRHSPKGPPARAGTEWFAYISVGEIAPRQTWIGDVPQSWRVGTNPAFGSTVVDQAQPEWPEFFAERVVRPLWELGWRG
ncbi:MAG TPA: hypothetical protein VGP15_23400, partial [Burkholderiales bacterium]|nr:hypothetical protein [Burkholderiales bacterium]